MKFFTREMVLFLFAEDEDKLVEKNVFRNGTFTRRCHKVIIRVGTNGN